MNPYAKLKQQKRTLAPYVVVDDGKASGKPEIALIRNCDIIEIAPVIRALSIYAGDSPDAPVQSCNVRLCGFKLTNSLGDGVTMQPNADPAAALSSDVIRDMGKRMRMAYQETRNQRKRRRRRARA